MLKFIKHHLETIAGIEVFPLISLILFFVFFVALTLYVFRADRKVIKHIAAIPLNDEPIEDEEN
ncbi:MAG: CcoQ/FixQ family Cbb3-type cytochrome c oxidase assembly chaperone [Bacteroidota bacterium]